MNKAKRVLMKLALITIISLLMYAVCQIDANIARGIVCVIGLLMCFVAGVYVWNLFWPIKIRYGE